MNNPEQFSNRIMNEALRKRATDIHFIPIDESVLIYFRINGYRWFYQNLSFKVYHGLMSYYKFVSGMDIAEKRLPQNGTMLYQLNQHTYDLRLSTLPTQNLESLAIRILPKDYFPDLEQLFIFPKQALKLMEWVQQQAGIILFTGPTGSGKSTSMYALVKKAIETYKFQAITLEDPVEQSIQNLLQVQVNEKAGFNYDVGLKAALRHDPDMIMIGEIRDEETARFAFRAALTGHLVISTVHAKNAFGTLSRLNEMGLHKSDLSQSIIGIASQQLINISISSSEDIGRRAAIAELLTGNNLDQAINGFPPESNHSYQTFAMLRRKAYALGYTHLSS
ncbi:competence type IV pilus ATPase ComGA [Tenuibacillus multivorans]|uniref:Competence protein ComGA n=1 Tax=Tenuibacillus multivorans TaxID=237069 RepID=A0A1G9Z8L8_9BACI|nr:competence type IV pilus ATPase ComGA [Tenuibacillus multivorans]GEL77345.1 ComG operon protein 1 [Tenuibacillus multivorans]SDN17898.1 competence protein ComGA [Tenuibacillus multivorans]